MTIPQDLPPLPPIDKKYDSQVHTHSSSITLTTPTSYDRLTTLGVPTLSLAILTILYTTSTADVRVLTKSKDNFISTETVTRWGRAYNLDTQINVGYGMLPLREDVRQTIAKDAFYARLGAAYLTEGVGLAGVIKFVEALIGGDLEKVTKGLLDGDVDKTACATLNERLCQLGIGIPEYVRGDEDGGFSVRCMIEGVNQGSGSGRTMKEAKQKAAKKVLGKGDKFFNSLRINVKRESSY
jgi:ribonuclease III